MARSRAHRTGWRVGERCVIAIVRGGQQEQINTAGKREKKKGKEGEKGKKGKEGKRGKEGEGGKESARRGGKARLKR